MEESIAWIHELARTPLLLVASDFDGTLAPIVNDPALAEVSREAVVALKTLAVMPQTHVAVISGRPLADLAARTSEIHDLHLVGSHGSEFETGFVIPLSGEARATHARLVAEMNRVAEVAPGLSVEVKPAAVAFHYRNASDKDAVEAIAAVVAGPGSWPDIHIRHGKKVIELSVLETNKGMALQRVRQRIGAAAVLFIGDDVTDEDAFATLAGPDIGVKVGPGESRATHRVDDTIEVAWLLAVLAEHRAAWLAGSGAVPIEHHALLSDQRTFALVAPGGRVVWMCLPRLDSAALFAELVGGPTAGYFEIAPVDAQRKPRQCYMADTFVLRTEWPSITLTDYLDCGGGRAFQRAGRSDLVRAVEGSGRVRITYAPRLDYGRVHTQLRIVEDGLKIEGSTDPVVLRAPGVQWELRQDGRHHTAVAEVELTGEPLVLELRYGTGNLAPDVNAEPARRQRNERFWSSWANTLVLPSVGTELVRRSALVLRALIYGPTGAIAAAATTSLPEHAGGVRNWDYRLCWPRDAAMAAAALVRLGATGPALRYLDWLLGILENGESSGMLRPVYTVTAGHLGPEGEITELSGYLGSRPVRVGNAAGQQVQLDVFGPIADLLALLAERGAALSSEHWRMLDTLMGAVRDRWAEPDHGIWEIRGPLQHYVHSKVMCWQTVDRALRVAGYLGHARPQWEELRTAIAEDVLSKGYRSECQAFGSTYASCQPDAAALSVGLSGLVPPNDERFLGTIKYIEQHLCTDGIVYRYHYDDGLPGLEGGFLLCNSWLIEAYALSGRLEEAQTMFEKLCTLAGPTGLFAEEWDPEHRRSLGNFPQAYTHIGLINAAVRLAASDTGR